MSDATVNMSNEEWGDNAARDGHPSPPVSWCWMRLACGGIRVTGEGGIPPSPRVKRQVQSIIRPEQHRGMRLDTGRTCSHSP